MTDDRTDLRAAAAGLADLREGVSDEAVAGRLETLADYLRTMADADRGPDHGRLDRLTHGLREVEDELDGEQAEAVRSALEDVRSYRETVEGV